MILTHDLMQVVPDTALQELRELLTLPKTGFDISVTRQQLHEEHNKQYHIGTLALYLILLIQAGIELKKELESMFP